MGVDEVIKSIYELMIPFSTAELPPVAYVSIEVGHEFPFSDEELTDSFNKIKWDSPLSSAELLILRKPQFLKQDNTLVLGGFSIFNEEVDGKIDDTGIVPTFCFIGKRII